MDNPWIVMGADPFPNPFSFRARGKLKLAQDFLLELVARGAPQKEITGKEKRDAYNRVRGLSGPTFKRWRNKSFESELTFSFSFTEVGKDGRYHRYRWGEDAEVKEVTTTAARPLGFRYAEGSNAILFLRAVYLMCNIPGKIPTALDMTSRELESLCKRMSGQFEFRIRSTILRPDRVERRFQLVRA